jgi:hypothetical protein
MRTTGRRSGLVPVRPGMRVSRSRSRARPGTAEHLTCLPGIRFRSVGIRWPVLARCGRQVGPGSNHEVEVGEKSADEHGLGGPLGKGTLAREVGVRRREVVPVAFDGPGPGCDDLAVDQQLVLRDQRTGGGGRPVQGECGLGVIRRARHTRAGHGVDCEAGDGAGCPGADGGQSGSRIVKGTSSGSPRCRHDLAAR